MTYFLRIFATFVRSLDMAVFHVYGVLPYTLGGSKQMGYFTLGTGDSTTVFQLRANDAEILASITKTVCKIPILIITIVYVD